MPDTETPFTWENIIPGQTIVCDYRSRILIGVVEAKRIRVIPATPIDNGWARAGAMFPETHVQECLVQWASGFKEKDGHQWRSYMSLMPIEHWIEHEQAKIDKYKKLVEKAKAMRWEK